MIRDAGDGAVRLPRAALCIGALEPPLHVQVVVKLGDVQGGGIRRVGRGALHRAIGFIVAVRADSAVVVVLDHHGVIGAGPDDSRRLVPAEQVGADVVAILVPLHQVALGVVIAAVGAVENAAVGAHGGRGRRVIQHAAAGAVIGGRVHVEVCTCATA